MRVSPSIIRLSIFVLAASLSFSASACAGDLQNGKRIFARANCVTCHLGGGNMMDPSHPIKGEAFAAKYNRDELLEATIRKGFPEIGMPSSGRASINDAEMKDLIAYVRSLTASPGKMQKAGSNAVKKAYSTRPKNP